MQAAYGINSSRPGATTLAGQAYNLHRLPNTAQSGKALSRRTRSWAPFSRIYRGTPFNPPRGCASAFTCLSQITRFQALVASRRGHATPPQCCPDNRLRSRMTLPNMSFLEGAHYSFVLHFGNPYSRTDCKVALATVESRRPCPPLHTLPHPANCFKVSEPLPTRTTQKKYTNCEFALGALGPLPLLGLGTPA